MQHRRFGLIKRSGGLAVLRRIATVRVRWAGVAAANKHTLAVTDGGAVYSWGDNSQGQLGYGTTDSAANGNPRVVEAMKVCSIAAHPAHTSASASSTCLNSLRNLGCVVAAAICSEQFTCGR